MSTQRRQPNDTERYNQNDDDRDFRNPEQDRDRHRNQDQERRPGSQHQNYRQEMSGGGRSQREGSNDREGQDRGNWREEDNGGGTSGGRGYDRGWNQGNQGSEDRGYRTEGSERNRMQGSGWQTIAPQNAEIGDYGQRGFNRPGFGSQQGFGSPGGSQRSGAWGGENAGGQQQDSHAGKGPRGYRRSDERIKEDVCEELSRHPGLDASTIDVDVKEGIVSLSGTVDDRRAKRTAEETIESLTGVKDVQNNIRVQASAASGKPSVAGSGNGDSREMAGSASRSGSTEADRKNQGERSKP